MTNWYAPPARAATAARARARQAIADAAPASFWTDRPDRPAPRARLTGARTADLVVIGGGFTGLWAAILAKQDNPAADVMLVEAERIAFGASGRNGGFVADSLTHGLSHGRSRWPTEMKSLVRLGRENLAAIAETVRGFGIDAGLRLCGKTTVAVAPHQVAELAALAELHRAYGDDVTLLDADQVRADVASPTYLAGVRLRGAGGLVDPARLAWGLAGLAESLGVTIHEDTRVTGFDRSRSGVVVRTTGGSVPCRQVVIGTNAYPPPLRRLRHWILPVYDYVLVTEPLSDAQRSQLRWPEAQGVTDAGNQFHYYRLTDDNRILFGGYDAIYRFGNRVDPALDQRDATHLLLAEHFAQTFPQLDGIRFTHRWGGVIDSTTRFTPIFGTTRDRRIAYAVGYTGLGVAASRFGAQVALDLLAGRETDRTRLQMVRRRPVPFPPEPLRYPVVEVTRRALAAADAHDGRRGPWLRLLDRFGVGFNS
ncbi:FAD-binding oxidoreductase [Micromonospora sp. DR5-3]|uniref:NAD(P)/FAD-dependent oxidoreductase n=1 Tax=unclassified Micromonospora TaxID=2617518 RepID=UPI0011DB6683|nr:MULTISPECIES: FAD-dependent oxidoreductase [unclassified Micromonospora]MCW3818134.1 FAD-binding oxidoreductase [Micromonospora sp. DR5-3]TYC21789.1 FAD-dependent oxidoreductase [Micromonospora sp. MP36]